MSQIDPQRILVIYHNADPTNRTRNTILEHIRVMEHSPTNHNIFYFNTHFATLKDKRVYLDLLRKVTDETFNAVLLHYSFLSRRHSGYSFYKFKRNFTWIRDIPGLKIALLQDEGDYAAVLDEWLFELGVSVILSTIYSPESPLYQIMRQKAAIKRCLVGYIDPDSAARVKNKVKPIAERKNDIIYRARRLPFRFGWSGQLKSEIGEVVAEHANRYNLCVDISTRRQDTILGANWLEFLASGKTVLGCESGYSGIDWRGELRVDAENILRNQPHISFNSFSKLMPPGWDDQSLFTVSPRHFEAVITKTAQILVKGNYEGIFQPNVHYIPLERDFSNIDDVLEQVQDCSFLQKMVDRAYEDIYLSKKYLYCRFAEQIEQIILEQPQPAGNSPEPEAGDVSEQSIWLLSQQLEALRQQNKVAEAMLPEYIFKEAFRPLKQRLENILPIFALLGIAGVVWLTLRKLLKI